MPVCICLSDFHLRTLADERSHFHVLRRCCSKGSEWVLVMKYATIAYISITKVSHNVKSDFMRGWKVQVSPPRSGLNVDQIFANSINNYQLPTDSDL